MGRKLVHDKKHEFWGKTKLQIQLNWFLLDANIQGTKKCYFCGKLRASKDRVDYDDYIENFVICKSAKKYLKKHPNSTRKDIGRTYKRHKTIICCKKCYHKQIDKLTEEKE